MPKSTSSSSSIAPQSNCYTSVKVEEAGATTPNTVGPKKKSAAPNSDVNEKNDFNPSSPPPIQQKEIGSGSNPASTPQQPKSNCYTSMKEDTAGGGGSVAAKGSGANPASKPSQQPKSNCYTNVAVKKETVDGDVSAAASAPPPKEGHYTVCKKKTAKQTDN